MTRYLFQRRAGSYFYKRRVPRDLRHRFAGRYIERNIGRVSAADARIRVASGRAPCDTQSTASQAVAFIAAPPCSERRKHDRPSRTYLRRNAERCALRRKKRFVPKRCRGLCRDGAALGILTTCGNAGYGPARGYAMRGLG